MIHMAKITYRAKIQELIREIDLINNNVAVMRDTGDLHEKKYYNGARGALFQAGGFLMSLDESLDASGRAEMEVGA